MNQFRMLLTLLRQQTTEWQGLRLRDLQFTHLSEGRLVLFGLLALSVFLLVARTLARRGTRHGVVLPALLRSLPQSRLMGLAHIPTVFFVLGLPFFLMAIADPFTALISKEVSMPGRRIGLLIDASLSMRTPFTAKLNKRQETDASFFTTVAAADQFVQMRMKSGYRDLISIVEFGDQPYVIMPFTADYENVRLSLSLIHDPTEFSTFPDQGTVIGRAIDEMVGLYKAFEFAEASGNMMIIFSDGEDSNYKVGGKSLSEILKSANDMKIPVYLVRINYGMSAGKNIPDEVWQPTINASGGRFYPVAQEEDLMAALVDLNKRATGSIEYKTYTSQEPRYASFGLMAAVFWVVGAALKLTVPYFQRLS